MKVNFLWLSLLFRFGKEKKNNFSFAFLSLIRNFELRSNLLSLGKEKKNNFSFAFLSLIRNFAATLTKYYKF